MTGRAAPSARDKLIGEAHLLGHLLADHVGDRKGDRQLIYFVDSHELKAYLHANQAEYLAGFVLDAEREQFQDRAFRELESQIRLKSERLLQWLLFDRAGPVILLPSHGEEINEEIAYQSNQVMHRQLGLVPAAKAEISRIRQSAFPSKLLSSLLGDAQRGDETSKARLLRFVGESAPALAALLRLTPDTIEERIKLLGGSSRLVLLDDAPWEEMGFDSTTSARIRALREDDALTDQWGSFLRSVRRNSFRSNRLDAGAISFLTVFNNLMQELHSKSHAVLVTRAMTLISMVRAGKGPPGPRRSASDLVRHSRLLVIPRGDVDPAAHQGNAEASKDDAVVAALRQLVVALNTYERQLVADDRPNAASEVDDAKVLVAAWHEFEAVRFAMELAENDTARQKSPVDLVGKEQFEELLRWLKTDDDVESLLVSKLNEGVWSFGQNMFAEHLPAKMAVRLRAARRPGRLRLQPVAGGSLAPVEVLASIYAGDTSGLDTPRGVVASLPEAPQGARDVAEDYLIWSFMHGCSLNWNLAAIYADSARLSAKILRRSATELEARLLQAQILRFDESKGLVEARRRFELARRTLAEAPGGQADPRVALELAALAIERLLCIAEDHASASRTFEEGMEHLASAWTRAAEDVYLHTRISELALIYLMAGSDKLQIPQETLAGIGDAQLWHRELVKRLSDARAGEAFVPEELPPLTRAIEIVGYEMIRKGAEGAARRDQNFEIPPPIQFDMQNLHAVLLKSNDKTSRMVAARLAEIMERSVGSHEYNLVYSPVWDMKETGNIFLTIRDDRARRDALEADGIIHEVGQRQRVLQGDQDDALRLEDASRLFQAALARTEGTSARTLFHLHMGHCYAALLQSQARGDPAERQKSLQALEAQYRELAASYPDSAVLHYRHSIVLSELGRGADAFEAVKLALTSLDDDPYIGEGQYWIRSTIVRRMAFHFAAEARDVSAELKVSPGDQALRTRYLKNIKDAFCTVYNGFQDEEHATNYLAQLENRRRLNNIVYYAALYVEGAGDLETLAEGFDREGLLRFTSKLQRAGLHEVSEWNIVHTIGYVYNVLGLKAQAREAANNLWDLISNSGVNAESPSIRHALNDAISWKRASDGMPSTTR